jgi:NAD(P)-dependent dehydrogenase (short-subunit alcohol dehydrogenase family)
MITGAGQGIGRGTAEYLAREGATVVVNDVNESTAQAVVDGIVAAGGRAMLGLADVTREDEINLLVDRVLTAYGRLDILVNNAGGSSWGGVHHMEFRSAPIDFLRRIVELNLISAFICSRAVINQMIEQRYGKIVCVSSIAAVLGAHNDAAYAAAKAGLHGFVATLAKEAGPYGINANVIVIGNAPSPRRKPERVELLNQWNHLGRHATYEEIARTIGFLVSDDAAYLSGSVLTCDGGTTRFALL